MVACVRLGSTHIVICGVGKYCTDMNICVVDMWDMGEGDMGLVGVGLDTTSMTCVDVVGGVLDTDMSVVGVDKVGMDEADVGAMGMDDVGV